MCSLMATYSGCSTLEFPLWPPILIRQKGWHKIVAIKCTGKEFFIFYFLNQRVAATIVHFFRSWEDSQRYFNFILITIVWFTRDRNQNPNMRCKNGLRIYPWPLNHSVVVKCISKDKVFNLCFRIHECLVEEKTNQEIWTGKLWLALSDGT